ncbi:MAG: PAS domain S-box protein [Candidatus Omnitrophica bacterium]|nr:PAS domain S-box protein [Candidatus Omnitrophota bacterium]
MIKSSSLKMRVSTNLMITIPLLMAILVFGAQIFSFYVVNAHFTKLVDDKDIYLFRRVVDILVKQVWIGTVLAGIFGLILAYAITLPIRRLTFSTKQIATGDLTRVVKIDSEDEIGALGKSFNAMVSSLNEHIIESMTGGVITISMEGKIITFNRSAEVILGYDSEEVINKSVFSTFPLSGINSVFSQILYDTLEKKKTSSSQEIAIYSRDGKKIPIGITTSLLRDKKNTLLGIVVTFKDLGHIKHLEEQMRRADRLAAVGSLAAGIAHEIRNPLGSVKGLVQLLQEDLKEDDRKKSYTDVIVKEVDRLNKVVEELLSFARPENSELEANLELLNINEVIEQTLLLATHDTKNVDIKIVKKYLKDLPMVLADAKKLQQAFLNIIINAFAAMGNGGTLNIGTVLASNNKMICVIFQDTGCGIPAEILSKIFDPFFTAREGGTGLGLTITHQIISSHNGKIDVKSEAGTGTSFIIYLPVTKDKD